MYGRITFATRSWVAVTPKVVHRKLAFGPAIPKRLQRNVEPDLVAKLEAVSDCLGRTEDRNLDGIDRELDHPVGKGLVRHANDAERWLVDARGDHALWDREPDFEGCLRADAVDPQRR